MKKTDLEKNKALKIVGKMKQSAIPSRFAADSSVVAIDHREQRKLDQAKGLVSFPIKLQQTLIEKIRARSAAQNLTASEIVGELLEKALKS
ncbi:MAG: hypothetical protein ABI155_03040 [Paralcaligenes sp.]